MLVEIEQFTSINTNEDNPRVYGATADVVVALMKEGERRGSEHPIRDPVAENRVRS